MIRIEAIDLYFCLWAAPGACWRALDRFGPEGSHLGRFRPYFLQIRGFHSTFGASFAGFLLDCLLPKLPTSFGDLPARRLLVKSSFCSIDTALAHQYQQFSWTVLSKDSIDLSCEPSGANTAVWSRSARRWPADRTRRTRPPSSNCSFATRSRTGSSSPRIRRSRSWIWTAAPFRSAVGANS